MLNAACHQMRNCWKQSGISEINTKRQYIIDKTLIPVEALQLALKREQGAEEFYLTYAKAFKDESARKMFEFLASEERKHQQIIHDEIDNNFMKEM